MFRMKIMLTGLLAMLALGSVASATASAALQGGPWFRHPSGAEQVKWPMNEEKEIEGKNQSSFQLKGKIAGVRANIECSTVVGKGNIWNGARQGEAETEVKFEKCIMSEPCQNTEVTIEPTKVYSELTWKYSGQTKELGEVGQQKIYAAFAPTAEPKEGRSLYTVIKVPIKCIASGLYPVEAAGTPATFVDQHQVEHKIVWGTAAEAAPQNKDALSGELIWQDPNVTHLHHQETPIEAKLILGKEPAELQGQFKINRPSEVEEFGVFNT